MWGFRVALWSIYTHPTLGRRCVIDKTQANALHAKRHTTRSEVVASWKDGNAFLHELQQTCEKWPVMWSGVERKGNKLIVNSAGGPTVDDIIEITMRKVYQVKVIHTYRDTKDPEHNGVEMYDKNEHPDRAGIAEGEQVSFFSGLFKR